MTHSICFAGLAKDEQAVVDGAFREANGRSGDRWTTANENDAAVVVVDMDSMYGQMSLMKALSNGKTVVALSAGARTDADFRLERPVTADGVAVLLAQLEAGVPAAPVAAAAEPEAAAVPAPAEPPAPIEAAAPAAVPEREPAAPEPTPEPAPAADPRLADWLRPGALPGPVRLQLADAPALVIDPGSQTYLSGAALKPLLPYATAIVREADLQPVDPAGLPALATELGGSQPLARLAWILAHGGGNGALLPGFNPNERYKLLKWPQMEREFPRHFRIATVMMKGPALLTEIAEQSGAALAEVIDFVNASLAVGVAEPEAPAPAEPEAAKGGLLGRFRR